MLQPFRRRASSRLWNEIQESAHLAAPVNGRRGSFDNLDMVRGRHRRFVVSAIFNTPESAEEIVAGLATDKKAARHSEVTARKTARRNGDQVIDGLDVVPLHRGAFDHRDRAWNFLNRHVESEHRGGWRIGNHLKWIDLGADIHRAGRLADLQRDGQVRRLVRRHDNAVLFKYLEAWNLYLDGVCARSQ